MARGLLIAVAMSEQADAVRRQVAGFAMSVLRFVRRLPREMAADSIIRQVARSAGSASASYRSACTARSPQEFVASLGTACDEINETDHWLWMAAQLGLGNSEELARLSAEVKELHAILSASLLTARRSLKRELEVSRRTK